MSPSHHLGGIGFRVANIAKFVACVLEREPHVSPRDLVFRLDRELIDNPLGPA
jgi:hypothetical protein